VAREKGVSACVGEGRNRWAAAHIADVARLYRLALENNEAGAKYHAVAEEGVAMRDIAEAIGRGLKVPVKSIIDDRGVGSAPTETACADNGDFTATSGTVYTKE
jgi:nucleoside-diphosphate-sugar epimerase